MARRPSNRDLSTGILIVLLAGVLVAQTMQAGATHQPANKAAANGSKVVVIPPDDQTQAVELLSATMRTSNPQDLIFSVSLECSIITQTYNLGGGPLTQGERKSSTSEAEGRVRVWVTIDGKIVSINSLNSGVPNQQSPIGEDSDKVTFCNRYHNQYVEDAEEDEDGDDGGDGTDTYRTYLRSKTANAFNWIYLNAGSAVHTIKVWGEFSAKPGTTGCAPDGQPTMTTCANAYVGNRTLTVYPERFANDASV